MNIRSMLFPKTSRRFMLIDWGTRAILSLGLLVFGMAAHYCATYGQAAQPIAFLPISTQQLLERGGVAVYATCYWLAIALLLPSVILRLTAVSVVSYVALTSGLTFSSVRTPSVDPYSALVIKEGPRSVQLATLDSQLWPFSDFAPDPELVYGHRLLSTAQDLLDMGMKISAQVRQNLDQGFPALQESIKAGHVPTTSQYQKAIPWLFRQGIQVVPAVHGKDLPGYPKKAH